MLCTQEIIFAESNKYQLLPMNNLAQASLSLKQPKLEKKIVIAHYHLFKNAGTSVDQILASNFGDRWKEVEFKKNFRQSNSNLVQDWLRDNQNISAFSSHTAMFPLPSVANICLIPIVFLRHPIVRLWSVYKFERKHKKILNESIKLAQKYDFAGYLNHQLDQPQNRSSRNFQTYRFSWLNTQSNLSELEQALKGLDSLEIVGIVEEFNLSMKYYERAIAQYYPSFKFKHVHKNITSQRHLSLEEKLEQISSNLDQTTYKRLQDANQDDLKLYEVARAKLLSLEVERGC